jgi:molybdopterin-binding protein
MANRTGIAAYRITAQQNYSGIIDSEIVNTDANTTVNIYTPAGVCVATHTTIHSAKQTLNKGIYIAKSSTSRPYKFIVK